MEAILIQEQWNENKAWLHTLPSMGGKLSYITLCLWPSSRECMQYDVRLREMDTAIHHRAQCLLISCRCLRCNKPEQVSDQLVN